MIEDAFSYHRLQRGRRADARLRLRLAARMVLLDGTRHCILTDLSTGGARIHQNERVRQGANAVLMWGRGLEAFGKIIWVAEHECGILFDEPLSSAALQATRQVDQSEHLPADRDMARRSAHDFVRDGIRL